MTKAATKKSAPPKPRPKARSGVSATRRIDGAGHIDPEHAERLRGLANENKDRDPVAFFQEPSTPDDLAEALGEEAVARMTTGNDDLAGKMNEPQDEERGGPFVETSGSTEFADGVDDSNTADATREPFPRT
jgi:hypothetical protein